MNEQIQAVLEQQLRDAHLPEAIGWWPLSPAWWVVIVACLITLAYLFYLLLRKHRDNRYRKTALNELQSYFIEWQGHRNSGAYLQGANQVLKRCVIRLKPSAANLSGRAWTDVLSHLTSAPLSEQTRVSLAELIYQNAPEIDAQAIHQELCRWLKQHKLEASHV